MFGPSTVSNGFSTETPPKCSTVPQPFANAAIAGASIRSAWVNAAPGGRASGNGAISVSRSV